MRLGLCFGVITPSAEQKVEGRIEWEKWREGTPGKRERDGSAHGWRHPSSQGSSAGWAAWTAGANVPLLSRLPSLQTGDAAPWVSVCVSLAGQV